MESKGRELVETAAELEAAGSPGPALKTYEEGLAVLLEALKSETRSEAKRSALRATIEANMSKAEALKQRNRRKPDHHDYTKVARVKNGKTTPEKKATPEKKNEPYTDAVLRDVLDKSPGVSWDDIAGLAEAKRTLQEAVILPHLRPDLYRGLRSPPVGVLLYGPPGTGKTMLAKAVASESGLTFFSVSSSTLTSKWVGDSEKLVKALFEAANQHQNAAIFLDELDALLSKRGDSEHEASRRLKTQFLVCLDGISSSDARTLFIGATNRPWDLDDALLRRLPRRILIPLPDAPARRAMLDMLLDGPKFSVPHKLTAKDITHIVHATEHFSMSDLRALAMEAALFPVRALGDRVRTAKPDDVRPIVFKDFKDALAVIKPSADTALLDTFEKWTRDFGTRG